MADEKKELRGFQETSLDDRKIAIENDLNDPIAIVERVYQLWWRWADFHLYVTSPYIDSIDPPVIIAPTQLPNSDEYEFVYPILDCGYRLSTSKGEDMFSAGLSMCKLYFTIEKMISILTERLKSGGISPQDEVQVSFGGHELAQRKAFESIINLSYNVVVSNFDPGAWGEQYLRNLKIIAEKGYGYPAETPRDTYKKSYSNTESKTKRF